MEGDTPESVEYAHAISTVFDRGSAAGRLLFNLYGGDASGKRAGNEYNSRNMQRLARRDGSSQPASVPAPPKVRFCFERSHSHSLAQNFVLVLIPFGPNRDPS